MTLNIKISCEVSALKTCCQNCCCRLAVMAEALEEIFSHEEFEESVIENAAQQYCSDLQCNVDKYFGCSMNNKRAQESEAQ